MSAESNEAREAAVCANPDCGKPESDVTHHFRQLDRYHAFQPAPAAPPPAARAHWVQIQPGLRTLIEPPSSAGRPPAAPCPVCAGQTFPSHISRDGTPVCGEHGPIAPVAAAPSGAREDCPDCGHHVSQHIAFGAGFTGCVSCSNLGIPVCHTIHAESLAKRFHETYERLAPSFGYETREASAKPWADVPEQNRRLMIAVCAELLTRGTP